MRHRLELLIQHVKLNKIDGNTHLHIAVVIGDPTMVELLLLRGADINATNTDNESALHKAVKVVQLQCVKVLLHYSCDINLQNRYGNTALHLAIDTRNMDLINLLCNYCDRVDFTLQNRKGFNILHYAAFQGSISAMKKLVTCAPHSVDQTNMYGSTALHMAAIREKHGREIAAILLSQHATIDLSDSSQQTPLHLATYRQNWAVVELLVHHNADTSKVNRYGDTALHKAINSGLRESVTLTPERCKDSPFIHAIWQNLKRQGERTELALACFLVSADKSGKLLEHARNNLNQTPLDVMKDLIGSAEFPRCACLLRSYNYYSHLRVKNSLGLMKYLRTREIM